MEKIIEHPDYHTLSAAEKSQFNLKMKDVFPKTETLKQQLLARFKQEFDAYQEEMVNRIQIMSSTICLLTIPVITSFPVGQKKVGRNGEARKGDGGIENPKRAGSAEAIDESRMGTYERRRASTTAANSDRFHSD